MRIFKSKELVVLEPENLVEPQSLCGASPSIMLKFEESAILDLQDRRDVISGEIDRLRVELANTELTIAAREASRAILVNGTKAPREIGTGDEL